MRVNEIFYSLQGEGAHTGTPCAFVRLSGCNLTCPWCDTSHHAYIDMTEGQIVDAVLSYPVRHVVVTGGEPAMQLTPTLLDAMHSHGLTVHVETNGTLPLPAGVDWVTCSPKGELALDRIDELKVVYWGQSVERYEGVDAAVRCLQPLDTGVPERNRQITDLTIDYILKNPIWKLSIQTHKILNVR